MGKKSSGRMKMIAAATVILGAAAAAIFFVKEIRVSHEYMVIKSQKNEDVQSTDYAQIENCLLKYSANEAVLLDAKLGTIWKKNYKMNDPEVAVQGKSAVIADIEGTTMVVLNKEAPRGVIETTMPILKAKVSDNGMVAAILQDGDKTWINFYTSKGSLIAENQTRIDKPGYPLDLAVSPDGHTVMVSYLLMEDGQTTSYVAFYNFGKEGQGKIDNIVAGYTYKNVIIPEVTYLRNGMSAAFRDDGYSIYNNDAAPKETVNKTIGGEIISAFHDNNYVGLVKKSKIEDVKYQIKLYNLSGKDKVSMDLNMEYDNIKISGDKIIVHNDETVIMYSLKGRERFQCDTTEGIVKDVFNLGSGQYILITDNGIKLIRLKA